MTRLRGHLRPGTTTLVVVFLALAGIAAFWAEPAQSVTGATGPVTVSVTDNGNAANGQTAHIHAQANTGDLFEIRAHLCAGGAAIKNTFNFSFDGPFCTPTPLAGGSDAETLVTIPAGSGGKGDLAFRLGEGTGKPWTDYWGTSHTLTCGPRNPCELVVQLQVTGNTVFYAAPICYGAPCPATGGDQPAGSQPAGAAGSASPPASTASGSGSPAGVGTGTTAAPAGGATGSVSGTATPAAPTSTVAARAATATANADPTGSKHTSGATAGLDGMTTTVLGRFTAHQALRVFAAGLAGLLGGVLLTLIGTRARRQMMGIET